MKGWLSFLHLLLSLHHSHAYLAPSSTKPTRNGDIHTRNGAYTHPVLPQQAPGSTRRVVHQHLQGANSSEQNIRGPRQEQEQDGTVTEADWSRHSERDTDEDYEEYYQYDCFNWDGEQNSSTQNYDSKDLRRYLRDSHQRRTRGSSQPQRLRRAIRRKRRQAKERNRAGHQRSSNSGWGSDDDTNESAETFHNGATQGSVSQSAAFSPSDTGSSLRCKRRSYHGVGPPSFHPSSPTNITAQLGASAYLPCRIRNLGNKSVSWFRQRDSHILTVDRTTFIADGRFSAWHEAGTQSWTLHIRYTQHRDAGLYECQVSTEPKMSHLVRLTVLKPTALIGGEHDQYVRVGSTVSLRCVINNAIEEPPFIFWYQNGLRVVQSDGSKRVIKASRSSTATTVSTLTITTVTSTDTGNYTCAPASITPSSVTLHVLHGGGTLPAQVFINNGGSRRDEHPAAMQHGTTSAAIKTFPLASTISTLCLVGAASATVTPKRLVSGVCALMLLLLVSSSKMEKNRQKQRHLQQLRQQHRREERKGFACFTLQKKQQRKMLKQNKSLKHLKQNTSIIILKRCNDRHDNSALRIFDT